MSKILIVEDEHRIARFLQMELEHEGFSTASESNGLRAYERIIQEDYDLAINRRFCPPRFSNAFMA